MKKFLVVYMASREQIASWSASSPEDQKKGMEEWMTWADANKVAMVDLGNPVGANKRVSADGVKDAPNEMCGYSVIQAESHDQAAEIISSNPHLKEPNAWTEVLEIVEM